MALTTLDRVQQDLKRPLGVVKVDVQGAESQVIQGARRAMKEKQIRSWIVGTHGNEQHDACRSQLSEQGYDLLFDELEVEGQPDGLLVARAT